MCALRRASNSIRKHAHHLGLPQAPCAALEVFCYNVEFVGDNYEHSLYVAKNCSSPKRLYHLSPAHLNSFVFTHGLSSKTEVQAIGDEGGLRNGFSELETPVDTNDIEENNGDEENAEDSISVHELSDADPEDNPLESAQDDLTLSDNEAIVEEDKVAIKKTSTSSLFEVIMDARRQSIHSAINKWIEKGNSISRSDYYVAMTILRKCQMFRRALQLSEWVETNKCFEFVERDYASRLDLIAKIHGVSRAAKYIEIIPKPYQVERVYRTLLASCAASVNVKKGEEVFNKMRDLGFELTVFTCNQLLLLYNRVDRKKIADVLLMMEKENVKPSSLTYKLLIDTKGRANDIVGMEQLLETMKAEGLEPDLQTQALVARYYITGGLHDKAEAVLKDMEGDDIKENRSARRLLLPLYASLGKPDKVSRIWRVCEASPHLDECLAAIEAWGIVGHVEKAEAVFATMRKAHKKLLPKYYCALLHVFANHRMLEKGKDLAKRMSDDGCPIGPHTWDALVKLVVCAGDVEKGDTILQEATQQGSMRPLFNSFITILQKYAERGAIHNSEKIFQRARQYGYTGRMQLYEMLLQAYINAKVPPYGFRQRLKADNIFPNKKLTELLSTVDPFKETHKIKSDSRFVFD